MGEKIIPQNQNIFKQYKEMRIINPYRDNSEVLPLWKDIDLYSFNGSSFDENPTNNRAISCQWFDNGNKFFSGNAFNSNLYRFDASTPYDVTTLSHNQTSTLSIGSGFYNIQFYNNGLNAIIGSSAILYKFSLSTSYDISTISYDSISYTLLSPCYAQFWSYDGMKFYAGNGGNIVYQYSVTIPYDISTIINDGNAPLSYMSLLYGLAIDPSGLKVFAMRNNGIVEQYTLTIPFDFLNGITYDNKQLNYTTQGTRCFDMHVNYDGSVITMIKFDGDILYQYT